MSDQITKPAKVLVVSLPGIMQNLLWETFAKRNDVDVTGVASGGLSAVNMIQQKQPDMVVIDSNLPVIETKALIVWMKAECEHTCSLVLAETTQRLKQAVNAGADIALLSYTLPENLDRVLRNLRTDESNTTRI